MTNKNIEILVSKWADCYAANNDIKSRDLIRSTLNHLVFIEKKLYNQYEPSSPPNPGYWKRLSDWLDNLKPEDQELAFNLAARLFFIGREEIKAMYRVAYRGQIMRWLINIESLNLNDAMLGFNLEKMLSETWFCPITDSFKINEFIHINNINNCINYRPDWQSLADLGDTDKVKKLMQDNNIKRIVLLEDFIATGTQAMKSIEFAASISNSMCPILVVPLVMCPKAKDNFRLKNFPSHVTIDPVLQLEDMHFISTDVMKNSADFNHFKQLAEKTYLQVTNGVYPHPNEKPYDPLGFEKTGGLLILNTNTPDNTLPLLHWQSVSWNPLFPRHSRV